MTLWMPSIKDTMQITHILFKEKMISQFNVLQSSEGRWVAPGSNLCRACRFSPMKLIPHLLLAALAGIFSGCASVSVKHSVFQPGTDLVQTPEAIYVRPFLLPNAGLRVDRKGADLGTFISEFQEAFSEKLTSRLTKHIAPAQAIGPSEPVERSNSWLIEGEFSRISQGSRALRATLGLGLGGTKMECVARVYDLRQGRRTPFAIIETTGGSNAEPGGIFSGPFVAAPHIVLTSVTSGVTPDARRTARMITATLSEYLTKSKANLPSKPMRAKQLGEIPGLPSNPLSKPPSS